MKCASCSDDINYWYIISKGNRGRFKCPSCGTRLKLNGAFKLSICLAIIFVFVPSHPLLLLIVFWVCYNIFIQIGIDDVETPKSEPLAGSDEK